MKRLKNRLEAGRLLSEKLQNYANRSDVLVLGLPRGGVPVAFEIATALHVLLDVCIVRKIGVPSHKELAMGAIGPGEVLTVNQEVVDNWGISDSVFQSVVEQERIELQRRDRLYRGTNPPVNVTDRTIILVDDGIATGSTLLAAIATLRHQQPSNIIVAVPVAPRSFCLKLQQQIDRLICLIAPTRFSAISCWYKDFSQTSDEEVQTLLKIHKLNSSSSPIPDITH
ncbi:MAG: phosphoribosyltransferase [Microcoleaceae cyanobacterium]